MLLRWSLLVGFLGLSASQAQEREIYVSDVGFNRAGPYQILRYDEDGGSPTVFATENVNRPQDVVFLEDEGEVLVSNFGTNRIDRYDLETGKRQALAAVPIGSYSDVI